MEKHLKRTAFFLMLLCTLGCVCFATPLIAVGTAEITGQTAKVPIELSGNTGICGAILSVQYDSELQLVEVVKGEALDTLTLTKPGKLSANPINLGWDGVEEDSSNGIIFYLTFVLPEHTGNFEIMLSYKDGDIVNGDLNPVNIQLQNGTIAAFSDKPNSNPSEDPTDPNKTVLMIETMTATRGKAIKMPIQLSGNKGICGASVQITYDPALALTGIEQGSALNSLSMTKPGKLTTSPITIGWDGLDQDTTNGTIAWLCFTTPNQVGTYSVDISYDGGNIVDGDLQPVEATTVSGQIVVQEEDITNVTVVIGNRSSILQGNPVGNSQVYVAYYSAAGKMLSVKIFPISDGGIYESAVSAAKTAKIFWLDENLQPVCKAKTIF